MTDSELVPDIGASALGGVFVRTLRRYGERQRPQMELGTITEDLGLMPDSWSARPWEWGQFSVANHLEIHPGDRVTVNWLGPRPLVQDLVGQDDDDDRNADHTRRRVQSLEDRMAALEQQLINHLSGHA
jgi:hypothetical protein